MYTVHFWEVICITLICNLVLSFAAQPDDIISDCANSTNSTSCIYTYEQVYKSLTKAENSFNISYALYPGRSKTSFLVFVNVYGPNKTSHSTPAMYTWSRSCLYAVVPARLLEVLSLGSILVTSTTQKLNIQIPRFCCNVSDNKEKREEIIRGFLTRAITELQDLAVIPDIRDPSLNTAECIRQGHKPKIDFTGRTACIRAMLWCSLVFAKCSGLLLAKYIKEAWNQECKEREKKNTVKSMCISFNILSVLGMLILIVAFGLSCDFWHKEQATFDIPIIFVWIIVLTVIECCYIVRNYLDDGEKRCLCLLNICGATSISYLFLWVIIGVRINPTWGLTIALIVLCLSAALTYAIYLYLEETSTAVHNITSSTTRSTTDSNSSQVVFFCVIGYLAVFLLFVIVVLVGQSYSDKEMAADEVLRTTSLYFISAFISWVTWKKHRSVQNAQPSSNETSPSTENNDQKTPLNATHLDLE